MRAPPVVARVCSAARSLLETIHDREPLAFAAADDESRESRESRERTPDVGGPRASRDVETVPDRDRGGDSKALRVLLVGPVQATGGIARYIDELRRRLPDTVSVAVYDTAAPPGAGPVRFARGLFGALADVARFPLHERPDVVHVHTAEQFSFLRKSAYVLLTRYLWRRPAILHVHGPTFDRFVADASGPLRVLQRTVFSASAAIVVLSPYWERVLGPYLPMGKVVVLQNAIDTDEYEPRFEIERPHVVFVSNHVPRKGIREFTEAVERLAATGVDCRVTIAGSGPLDDRAKRLAERYADVEYLGYVSEARKRELLCEASIYVLPAYAEGLPIGVLEGMAGGNAIVATDVGGVPDLVDEKGGKLVPPRDAAALAAALETLVGTPEEVSEMGRRNAERVAAYTWERVIPRLVDLYESVAAERSNESSQ